MRSWCHRRTLLVAVGLILMLAIAFLWASICAPKFLRITSVDKGKVLERLRLLHRTVIALDKAIDHLSAVGENLNVDAAFAVRLVHDQLTAILHQIVLRGGSVVQELHFSHVLIRLSNLQEKSYKLWQQSKKSLRKKEPEYYERMRTFMQDGAWDFWFPSKYVDRRLMPSYGFRDTFQEHLPPYASDVCMYEPYIKQCRFTENCWNIMASTGYHGYSLTHEVLFILNGVAIGCGQEIEAGAQKFKKMTKDELLDIEIAAILHEAELIAGKDYPIYSRDLFMEQIALGGVTGYRDFFRDEWLLKILSWQNDEGCYSLNATGVSDQLYDEQVSTSPTRRRQKRDERFLEDNCWAHLTAVAIVALGQYIRYLLESILDDVF